MKKFAIGLLTLVIYATAVVAVPVVSPANAVTDSSKHTKKHKKQAQQGPGVSHAKSQNPGYPSIYEDPDRKAAGGGY
jgi:hypothetical protein